MARERVVACSAQRPGEAPARAPRRCSSSRTRGSARAAAVPAARMNFHRLRRGPRSRPGASRRASGAQRAPARPKCAEGRLPIRAADLAREMARVTREDLVAADAAEHDRHLLSSLAADQVRRDRCRVGDGLLEMPDRLRKEVEHVGFEDPLVVVGLESRPDLCARNAGRRARSRARDPSVEPDRPRAHRSATDAHRGDDRRRVDAAAEEAPERDVADHLPLDRAAHRLRAPRRAIRLRAVPPARTRDPSTGSILSPSVPTHA